MHRLAKSGSRLLLPCLGVLLAAGLLWGLGAALATGGSPSPSGKTVLRVGWVAEPDNLNPFIGYATASYEVWSLNYDTLVGYSVKDFTPVATGLAQSWDESQDGKVYTFHLRQGVKWQDGQPFTADDVAWTYNYIITNKMSAFTQCTEGIKEAKVVDPSTVQLICTKPKADILSIWVPILPKHVWQNVSPKAAGNTYAVNMPIVGTGPFQCRAFKKGDYVDMVANKEYFRGAPHIDEVLFEDYSSADAMTADFKSGGIDAAQDLPQAQFDVIARTKGLTAVAYNYRNWDYLSINCDTSSASKGNPILRDVRFRQALNWAIDKQKLAAVAWSGRAQPGTTVLPSGEWFNPDYHWQPPADVAYRFDPAKAEQLLDQAGYTDTNGDGVRDFHGKPIDLRLYADSSSTEQQSEAKLIAGELQRVGVKVRLSMLASGSLSDDVWNYVGSTYAPDFDLYVWNWDGYFDPGQTLASFTTNQIGGWNEPCWSNAEYDKLCAQQAVTTDTTARQQLIWRMQQIMYEQSPEIVLTYPRYLQAYNSAKWTGWTRILNGTGPAFYVTMPDTYLNLRLASARSAGRSSTLWIALVVVAAAAVVGAAAWLIRRGLVKEAEE
jgi:peptide/nickel transport system substrate-binding protein